MHPHTPHAPILFIFFIIVLSIQLPSDPNTALPWCSLLSSIINSFSAFADTYSVCGKNPGMNELDIYSFR